MAAVQDTRENREKCLCPGCPSYPHDCEGEILYCGMGKSDCDIKARGCNCSNCPVYYEYKLNGLFFCDKEEVGLSGFVMRKKRSDEDGSFYQGIVNIKDIANTGESIPCSMGSLKKLPFSLDDLHFVPAQVDRIPLNRDEEVNTAIVIGSRKPLRASTPIMITGMSFGAVSKNVRQVIALTAAQLKMAFNSGEGGILEDEIKIAKDFYIGQYATGRFGVGEELLKKVAAVEIRFSQGAYPGKGSYLPASKMTPEVAKARGLKRGEAAYSPAHHPDMTTPQHVKDKVSWLRDITGGVPIGAKIGCGNIENDLRVLVDAGVDFIALDGFGGGTGATELYVRENVGIPIFAALPRAFKYLTELGVKDRIFLIAGGDLRTSADFAKCLALGADAVYIGTPALIAMNCEQYRICYTGLCPTGVTTHNPVLLTQLNVEKGVEKLTNFIEVSTREIANLARIVGKDDINKLDSNDLVSMNRELAAITGTRWMNWGVY
ncbi:glutamate synthase-related protein [Candidatus Methanoperedens nitratireducens]|uniref:Archaeal glutamate synthase [NADPH] n=1 Tax=Candidatus Methanoperedens nitratireducens TaxID=1392998 RepID=A0A284VJZ8_9EURY|nr:glutamate synthase-related protein [Candidatus Methanoperedens nitroreducens]SNQ59616.1 Archaeal glutamate synthase (NADPH) [Candidatus Methanoperedens nitroreducens]